MKTRPFSSYRSTRRNVWRDHQGEWKGIQPKFYLNRFRLPRKTLRPYPGKVVAVLMRIE